MDLAPDSTMPLAKPVVVPERATTATPAGVAPILTALTETLGLRLQPKKGPVAVFVIEKIERPGQN